MAKDRTEEQQARRAANAAQVENGLASLRSVVLEMTPAEKKGAVKLLTWHQEQQEGESPLYLKKCGQVLKKAFAEFVS